MIPPTVVNIRRAKPYDLLILRGSKWGNPYRISHTCTRDQAIALHLEFVLRSDRLMRELPELAGLRLGCVCKPLPCHGDNYVHLFNTATGILL